MRLSHDNSERLIAIPGCRLGHSAMSVQCPVCPKADTAELFMATSYCGSGCEDGGRARSGSQSTTRSSRRALSFARPRSRAAALSACQRLACGSDHSPVGSPPQWIAGQCHGRSCSRRHSSLFAAHQSSHAGQSMRGGTSAQVHFNGILCIRRNRSTARGVIGTTAGRGMRVRLATTRSPPNLARRHPA
jgi:hypothetical protein